MFAQYFNGLTNYNQPSRYVAKMHNITQDSVFQKTLPSPTYYLGNQDIAEIQF